MGKSKLGKFISKSNKTAEKDSCIIAIIAIRFDAVRRIQYARDHLEGIPKPSRRITEIESPQKSDVV